MMPIDLIPGGFLVVVEGIDGAGKTTLVRTLMATLAQTRLLAHSSKEPTHGQWGQRLRDSAKHGRLLPAQEMDYLLRDRQEHVTQWIQPALAQGAVVVLDRYYPSMFAYQGAAGIPIAQLQQANAFAPPPDVLLIVDVDPALGQARIRARGDAPNHFEQLANLQDCRRLFLELHLPGKHIIDGHLPADAVAQHGWQRIVTAIQQRLDHLGRQLTDPLPTMPVMTP